MIISKGANSRDNDYCWFWIWQYYCDNCNRSAISATQLHFKEWCECLYLFTRSFIENFISLLNGYNPLFVDFLPYICILWMFWFSVYLPMWKFCGIFLCNEGFSFHILNWVWNMLLFFLMLIFYCLLNIELMCKGEKHN